MLSGLRLALLKPAALPVTPSSDPPLSLLLLRCILCLVFVILFTLFIAWKCSLVASWCTLCVGTPKFSRGVQNTIKRPFLIFEYPFLSALLKLHVHVI